MSIEIGEKVKVTTVKNEEVIGILSHILIGVDPANPTKTSIIVEDKKNDVQEMLWTDGLEDIVKTN